MNLKELNNAPSEESGNVTLPKALILRGKRNFDRLFSKSERLGAPFIVLRYKIYPEAQEGFQVGFISKKKLGNAVHRNKIRRLMREAFRLNQQIILPELDKQQVGLHMVLMAQSVDVDFEVVNSSVKTLLEQLRKRISLKKSES